MSLIRTTRTPDGSEGDIDIALPEALADAIVHGNREDPSKHVKVICRCTVDGAVYITIRDEGDGFDNSSTPDPTAPENWMSTHGRGIYLIWFLMDEIRFENRGTVVHMSKRPPAKRCKPFPTEHIGSTTESKG
jgi:serine/threonine-protein kinase RsbW